METAQSLGDDTRALGTRPKWASERGDLRGRSGLLGATVGALLAFGEVVWACFGLVFGNGVDGVLNIGVGGFLHDVLLALPRKSIVQATRIFQIRITLHGHVSEARETFKDQFNHDVLEKHYSEQPPVSFQIQITVHGQVSRPQATITERQANCCENLTASRITEKCHPQAFATTHSACHPCELCTQSSTVL